MLLTLREKYLGLHCFAALKILSEAAVEDWAKTFRFVFRFIV